MAVTPTTSSTTTTTTTSNIPTYTPPAQFPAVGSSTLSESDFMKLFITQMQYQDPSNPMSTNDMASQLAQFSNMDATMKMSDSMDSLLAYQKSQNNLQLLSLLNTHVQAVGNNVMVQNGTPTEAQFVLPDAAASCVVNISDANGNLVQQINYGSLAAGTQELNWDGKNYAGQQVPDGTYTYSVDATDASGNTVSVESHMSGNVTGVQFTNGQAEVTLDSGVPVQVSDITNVVSQ